MKMTLAAVAYQISTDSSLASLIKESPEDALKRFGISLTPEEKAALQKVISIPGLVTSLLDNVLKAEPWVYCA
jgi:hypothetical protein